MLAYAADTRPAGRAGSPKALALILTGHAALLAAVLTAKMELATDTPFDPTTIINIPVDPPPPEPQPKVESVQKQPVTQRSFIEQPTTIVDMDATSPVNLDRGQAIEDIATVIGTDVSFSQLDPPKHVPIKIAARFVTPDSALKPPYPLDKRREGEEATLKLRLTIDTRGRVTAVEPVGAADPSFLEAARHHIVRSWRYKPATEDGVAVPSSTVINLDFRLEDV